MEKGLRTPLVQLYVDAFEQRGFFKQVLVHAPSWPFPARELLPSLYIAVMPWDIQDETNNERKNDFRISVTVLLEQGADDALGLLQCDAADEVEEALTDLSRSAAYARYSNLVIQRVDTTPLSLLPFGINQVQLAPPFGAIRVDTVNDFHYQAVTA